MIERGGGVNVMSVGASIGTPTRAAYAATKATLESLMTRNWAVEAEQRAEGVAVALNG